MDKIRIGIIGGAGYTAGELLRLLLAHPHAELVFVHSSSQAGKPLAELHAGLFGESDLLFSSSLPLDEVDLLFLCSAHGDSRKFIEENRIAERVKIIDLSTDYRQASPEHDFVYGLPELNAAAIRRAGHVANPGCFATAIQLALLPLAAAGMLRNEVHINAITGSTGAGAKASSTSHFSWRNNNISVYKAFEHQHLAEIKQSLRQVQDGFAPELHFIPVRGNFTRGIYAMLYSESDLSIEEAHRLYTEYYASSAFTHISPCSPDLKQVVNTNKALLHLEKHGKQLFIISTIDNLLKGASGQAVQNMNLMFGLDEKTGLGLKASAF